MLFPPYQQLVWDYKKSDPNNVRKSLYLVNRERLFDQKSIDIKVATFNDIILNTSHNFVRNKYITIDDKVPIWINEIIKSKMKAKHILYKKYVQNRRFESDFIFLEDLLTELNELISSTKALHYESPGKN